MLSKLATFSYIHWVVDKDFSFEILSNKNAFQ